MISKESGNSPLKKWLENLQQESWQLELLISGFATYGLFGLRSYLLQQILLLNANFHSDQLLNINFLLLSGAYFVVHIFIINLFAHIIIRGLWIGAIGLRSVSGDINYNDLNYNDKFITYYKKVVGSFDDYILRLEKLASIIFSFTFLLFFIFCSLFLFAIEIKIVEIFFSYFINSHFIDSFFWIQTKRLIFFFGFLVALDFITLGLLKKIKQKHFTHFYFFIYKIVGNVTLSFLWRPLLLNFLDQKETKKILMFIVPYIIIVLIILPSSNVSEFKYFPNLSNTKGSISNHELSNIINKHSYNNVFYGGSDNSWNSYRKGNISQLYIPNYKLKSDLFEVFIKYDIETENYISQYDSSIFSISTTGYSNDLFRFSNPLTLLTYQKYEQNIIAIKEAIKSSILLSIDDQPINNENLNCNFFIHPNAGEKGILCFFPIELKNGKHQLEYKKMMRSQTVSSKIDTISFSIPFVFDR